MRPAVDPEMERVWISERTLFAERIDRELQVACRMEAAARRELGSAAESFLRRRAYRRLGFVRLRDYTRERLGISARTVEVAAWVATRLETLPAVGRAFDRSEISWTQARVLCAVASPADEERWLERIRESSVDALERLARRAQPRRGVAADPAAYEHEIDGEPAARLRLACPARVRALWRRALALAARVAGEDLCDWRAAEIIAAEGFSGRPAGATIADRALRACLRAAVRRGRMAGADPASSGNVPAGDDTVAIQADPARPPVLPHRSPRAHARVDPFALDARLVAALRALRTTEPQIGRLLRLLVDHRFYRLLGFPSVDAYVRERLGIATRTAWALLKVEKATARSAAFARAYREGTLSWARALALLPVLEREHAPAWIARAATVTVRRLCDEVSWVLETRDAFGNGVSLAPPPLGTRLTPPAARAEAGAPQGRVMSPAAAVQTGAPGAPAAGGSQCRDTALAAAVHIGAPEVTAGAACSPAAEEMAMAADRARRAHAEVCDVEVAFTGPASIVALVRDVLDAFAQLGAPRWAALEALLRHVIAYWERTPRHRDPIFARDGWRCTVPACSARRNLHDHHLRFRSRGGGNERGNRTTICAAHHLHGIHDGTIRAAGTAPDHIHWQIGVRAGAPPFLTYVGDRVCGAV